MGTVEAYRKRDRELAVLGFVSLQGGWINYFLNGGKLEDLIPLMDETAESDALEGLIKIGRSATADPVVYRSESEPAITPGAARHWLLSNKHAVEKGGELELTGDDPSHIAVAGLRIALGTEPQLLSDAYSGLSDHTKPLSDYVLGQMAAEIVRSYEAAETPSE